MSKVNTLLWPPVSTSISSLAFKLKFPFHIELSTRILILDRFRSQTRIRIRIQIQAALISRSNGQDFHSVRDEQLLASGGQFKFKLSQTAENNFHLI